MKNLPIDDRQVDINHFKASQNINPERVQIHKCYDNACNGALIVVKRGNVFTIMRCLECKKIMHKLN